MLFSLLAVSMMGADLTCTSDPQPATEPPALPVWEPEVIDCSAPTGAGKIAYLRNSFVQAMNPTGGVEASTGTFGAAPSLTPSGDRFLYVSQAYSLEGPTTMDLFGNDKQQLVPSTTAGNPDMAIDCSTGHRMLAWQEGGVTNGIIYVKDLDAGTGAVNLGAGSHPTWSPDGQSIIFSRPGALGSPNTSDDLWADSGADGTAALQLTDTPSFDELQPDWSSQNEIAFVRAPLAVNNHFGTIWRMKAEPLDDTTNPAVQITATTDKDQEPTWSPDGSQIAFGSLRDGQADIFVTGRNTDDPETNLTSTSNDNHQAPNWGP